ncbi:hypothetical protein, partial [Salmonella sp. s58760]|uniref:hypothetical protein n=1 Tax=Salmonella sp. s58760 TaxID=3159708 RepID=UPI00398066F9
IQQNAKIKIIEYSFSGFVRFLFASLAQAHHSDRAVARGCGGPLFPTQARRRSDPAVRAHSG